MSKNVDLAKLPKFDQLPVKEGAPPEFGLGRVRRQ